MKREEKLIINTIVLAIGNFIPKLASIVILPLLTACLTKAEYGTYDLIVVLVSLILPAATLQISTAAFRFLIDCRNDIKKTKTIITNIFGFIIPVSAVALIGVYYLLNLENRQIKILVCFYFFIDILLNAAGQVTRGLSKNLVFSLSSVFKSLFQVVTAIICIYVLNWGLFGALLSLILADLGALLFLFVKNQICSYINFKLLSKSEILELAKYSWPMVPNSLGLWVMRLSNRLVITSVLGVTANAVYAVANKIPSLLTIAQSTFTMAWQENASIASKDNDVNKYYSDMFSTMFDFYAGTLGLLIALTPVLFSLLIRGEYEEAYYQMPLLFIGVFFNCMTAYLGGIYVAFKETKSVGITTLFAAISNLLIDLIFVRSIGIYAASISTLVSYLLLFIFRSVNIRKIVKLKYNYKKMMFGFVVMLIESVLCYFRNPALNIVNGFLGVLMFILLARSFIKLTIASFAHRIRKKA